MSCWTEYVVADATDAKAVASATVPRNRWAGFEGLKGFGAPHHAALADVLGSAAAEADFARLTFGDAGMVAPLPPDFLRAVRTVPDDHVAGTAARWGARLAERGVRVPQGELAGLLGRLRDLARQAEGSGQSVLFWQGFE
jgi:hypothetical protein